MDKKIFFILFLSIAIEYSCHEINYASKMHSSSKNFFLAHKKFLKSFSFDGIIISKHTCDSCDINKYQLGMKIFSKNVDSVSFENKSYQPYYFFEGDNNLYISVPKNIFDSVAMNIHLGKKANSNELVYQNKALLFLSDKDSFWFDNTRN